MWPAHMPRATTRRRGGTVLTNTTEIGTAILPLRSVTIPALADVSPSALAYVRAFVRTAGDAGQVAWRIPAASAAGIVRSGPGAGRDVRECETEILCASKPDGLAAGALPGARRRCEAGKRTHGPGPRACLALLAAAALLALAAPAQAQTEIWSATLTPQEIGSGSVLGCDNNDSNTGAACSITSVFSDDDFTHGTTDHVIGVFSLQSGGSLTLGSTSSFTDIDTLVLVLGTTSLAFSDAINLSFGAFFIWSGTGLSWTAGTDVSVRLISLTAPGAPTGLAATANGPSRIDLAWTAPASTARAPDLPAGLVRV